MFLYVFQERFKTMKLWMFKNFGEVEQHLIKIQTHKYMALSNYLIWDVWKCPYFYNF